MIGVKVKSPKTGDGRRETGDGRRETGDGRLSEQKSFSEVILSLDSY